MQCVNMIFLKWPYFLFNRNKFVYKKKQEVKSKLVNIVIINILVFYLTFNEKGLNIWKILVEKNFV